MSAKTAKTSDACRRPAFRRQAGLTLVELVVFIIIVSVALSGVLLAFNTVVRSSADPLVSRQLQAVAEAMLEEVLLQDFTAAPGGGAGTSRNDFDNVDQYKAFDSGSAGITYPDGTSVSGLEDYRVTVKVVASTATWGTTNAIPAASVKLITVTASRQGLSQNFVLSGYRTEDPAQ